MSLDLDYQCTEEVDDSIVANDSSQEESEKIYYYENKHEIVTRVAFLCGVSDYHLNGENSAFLPDVISTLGSDEKALIVRNLCLLRNSIEHNFKKIAMAMSKDGRAFFGLTEFIPKPSLSYIENHSIRLPTTSRNLTDILAEINRAISDRINNCKDIFPTWVNWNYIRELFVMPDGTKQAGMLKAASQFYENINYYPYKTYINWKPHEVGNLFKNDYFFMREIYEQHGDRVFHTSNLSDVSDGIKERIYDFLDNSSKTVLIVDCENADPYALCAMFRSLDESQVEKIDKVILYDDPKAASGWRFFEKYIGVDQSKIEHILIQRILDYKSLLDVKLTARVTKEFYKEKVESFVLVSSDSDFWGLMEEIPDAKFLVMIEHRKSSVELRKVLEEHNIFYCFADAFYTGMDDSLKKQAIFSELTAILDLKSFNARDLLEEVLVTTRVEMDQAEKNRFYDKYLKNMQLRVSKDGIVKLDIRK